ncbi:LysR family transcriptional regulator [uncultured Clostridium sp.]|uniref:LysR family transcriptional regulator n=1 Tax=uncultured Clostridium sp. TaxID=59620 RepID=UPI0028E5202F|nr:LysR family transcriptional regulator [uncultured Clostridium sp.]
MDIKSLTYFRTIVDEGNITKAAEKLHMAQPPLSNSLKLLEEELGVKLLERNTRKLQVTDAGRILYRRCDQMLELMDTTIKELRDLNEGLEGTLSIGIISACSNTILPSKIHAFNLKYPKINFDIRETGSDNIIELLERGVIEIGIIRSPYNLETFESILLPDEPMVAVAKDNYLNHINTESILLTELADKPLLIHRRYERMILETCRKAGFEPRILGKIEDTSSILLWAYTGIGVAIIPKDWINLVPNTNLKYKEINEPSLITRTAILWMKDRHLSRVARNFIKTFSEQTKI